MTNRDSFGHLRALVSSPHRAFRTVALAALMAGTIAFPATALGQDKNPLPNTTERAKPATQEQAKPDNSKGAKLYERYCALCHGADREGYAADHSPSLRSPELMGSAPGGYLWSAVTYGRPGTPMAAFAASQGGPLSHGDQHILMDWLFKKANVQRTPVADVPVVGDATLGAAVYDTHCAECHGAKGEGGTGTALANPVYLATASDAFIRHAVANGRTGTPMAAFAERLSDADIDNVVAFLRSRAVGWEAGDPVLAPPPNPAQAVINPTAPPAKLVERKNRFVSSASVASAMERGERMVLLDARPMSDWQRSHLPGALPMPFYDGVDELIPHLPNDGTPIVAYCACPHAASGRVVDALKKAGFSSARILDEGVLVWAGLGYPIAVGAAPESESE